MSDGFMTGLTSVLSGFVGAWLGSFVALARFRKERAFDRQLAWYEEMIGALHEMAQRIEIAVTFQRTAGTAADLLTKVWRDVQSSHLAVDRLSLRAALYGSATAGDVVDAIAKKVQRVANETEAFDPPAVSDKGIAAVTDLVETLPTQLRKAAAPLAEEARHHLGLG